MKLLSKIILLGFISGVVLTIIAISNGVNLNNLESYFIDDSEYGEAIIYTNSATIDTLNLDLITKDIKVVASTSDHIVITYYAHEDDTWTVNEANGTLSIVQTSKPFTVHWFNFKFPSAEVKTVKVEVPTFLIVDYAFSVVTGDINLSNINASNIDMATITGDINIESSTIESKIDLSVITGDIIINNTNASSYDLSSTTGDIEFSNSSVLALTYDLSVVTGKIIVNENNQGNKHLTTSGTIPIKAKVITGDIIISVQD